MIQSTTANSPVSQTSANAASTETPSTGGDFAALLAALSGAAPSLLQSDSEAGSAELPLPPAEPEAEDSEGDAELRAAELAAAILAPIVQATLAAARVTDASEPLAGTSLDADAALVSALALTDRAAAAGPQTQLPIDDFLAAQSAGELPLPSAPIGASVAAPVPSTNVPIAPLPTNPASHESFANALASLESPATAQAQNPVQPNGDANPAATTAGAMPNELALAKLERLPERIGAPPLPARANPAAEAATPRASDPSSAAQLPALATLATPADADTAPNSGDAREGAQQRLHAPQLADSLAESALAQAFDRANSGATALGDASASIDSVPTAGADTGVDASSDIGSAASQAAHSLTHNPLAPRHLDPMRSAEQAAETSGPPLPPEAVPLHVEWLAERGGGTAVVDLHPPNLGRVEIAVRVVGDEVEVSIASQSDQVQAVIDSQRGQLEQSLGERSLRMTQFDLGLAGQNQSQRGNASSSRDPNGSARERREGADGRSRSSSLVPVVGAPIGSGPRSRAASGIDLHA